MSGYSVAGHGGTAPCARSDIGMKREREHVRCFLGNVELRPVLLGFVSDPS